MKPILGLLLLVPCLTLSPAWADVVNGNFEFGSQGWSVIQPPDWEITFPPAGGNPDGYASILSRFWDSEGEGCVHQTFVCGDEGTCTISFDAMMAWLDSNELAGRLKVYANGVLKWTAPAVNELPWTPVVIDTDCGTVRLDLCLEVDPGNNMWQGGYDNVAAVCEEVPVEHLGWGTVKGLYR